MRRLLRILLATAFATAACSPAAVPVAPPPPPPVALVVWSPWELPLSVVRAVPALPGVVASTPVASGTLNLMGTRGASKRLPERPRGALLPVSVTALDPAALVATGEMGEVAGALGRNRAALTRTSALLRGLSAGDAVRLSGAGVARSFRVDAVVAETPLVSAEIVLPYASAGDLGLGGPRAMVLAVRKDRLEETTREVRARLAGIPSRVGSFSSVGAELSYLLEPAQVKTLFGEFWFRRVRGDRFAIDPEWVSENIVEQTLPLLGRTKCNRRIVSQLVGAMRELIALRLDGLVRQDSGCFSPRTQFANSGALSRHAWGIAVDINASQNRYGFPPTQDGRLVEVMERWGFTWGGRWTVPDGMHFEFIRYP